MLLLSLLLVSTLVFSQVTQEWVKRYNGFSEGEVGASNRDEATALAVDGSGNVYVTGRSEGNGTDFDYATVKYNAAGAEIWARRYNGPGNSNDGAKDIAVDSAGNVYVTGSSKDEGSVTGIVTTKYDAAGNQLWLRRYKYPFNNVSSSAADMAVDAAGNVYVTGVGQGSEVLFYITIKYNTAGTQLWEQYYGSEGGGDAVATALALDGSGNVYVTGQSSPKYGIIENRYTTIKYNTNGTELWMRNYDNPDIDISSVTAYALAVDASGNVYVTGNIGTVKYSAGEGGGWERDAGSSVAVDGSGNVYVLNLSRTTKYDAAGNVLWTRYGGGGEGTSLVLDGLGNVYTAGGAPPPDKENTDITDYNFFTRKYDAAGNQLWVQYYDGPEHTVDVATALAVDASGNVYVTGRTDDALEYTTIKYSQMQTVQKVSSFTLIDADNNTAIRELKDGDTLDLAALSFRNINIRANTTPDIIGSVVFNLSGEQLRNHTENLRPYALFADDKNGDIYAWKPAEGNYTLTATPYNGAKGSGGKGNALTIHFHVQYRKVSSFTLVNADTDTDIGPLRNGDVIDLSKIGTQNLNIRANTSPDTVGSVVLVLNDNYSRRHTENIAPYAWFADNKQGDYYAWTPTAGNYSLYAIPYELAKGRGRSGPVRTVVFSVVTGASALRPAAPLTKLQQAPAAGEAAVKETLVAMPNPAIGQTTIRFSVPNSGFTALDLYDNKGAPVQRLYQAWAEAGKVYSVPFQRRQLSNGVYMLRTVTGTRTQSYKLVLLK